MKKKLLIPAITILTFMVLGLTLFLTRQDASSQDPVAPGRKVTKVSAPPDQSSPDQATITTQSTIPSETAPENTAPTEVIPARNLIPDGTIVSEDGNLAIVYNANCNYDLYADSHAGNVFRITIISTNPIDEDTISADALGLQEEAYSVADSTEFLQYEWEDQSYITQTLAGTDWAYALSLYEAMDSAKETYFSDTSNAANREFYTKAMQNHRDYMNTMFSEGFALQMKPANANFYAYNVYLDFNNLAVEAVVEEIALKIGADSYLLPVGQIRFHPFFVETYGVPMWFSSTPAGFSTNVNNVQVSPWDDGQFSAGFQFSVPENMILERLEVLTEDGTVIDEIWIDHVDAVSWAQWQERTDEKYSGQEGYGETFLIGPDEEFLSGFRFFWDGKMSVYLNAGDQVYVNLSLHSPELAQCAHYQNVVRYILHYATAEGEFAITMEHELQQEQCYYALYYTYLGDVDFRSYFPYREKAEG